MAALVMSGSAYAFPPFKEVNLICKVPASSGIFALLGDKVSLSLSEPSPFAEDEMLLKAKVDMPTRARGIYNAHVLYDKDGNAESMKIETRKSRFNLNIKTMKGDFEGENYSQEDMSCWFK